MNISSFAANRNAASLSAISMLLNSTVVSYNNQQSDTNTGNGAGKPLSAAQQRVQAEVDSTRAQLSSFGVLKSALSQSQIAAQAAGKLGDQSTDSDVTRVMGNLFNGYNAVVTAAKSAAGANAGANKDSTGSATRAAAVGKDLQRSTSSGTTADALKKLGVSVQTDGTWVQDAKVFADALKADPKGVIAAMAKVGAAMNTVAGKELDQSGNVSNAMNQLNHHSTSLAARQQALTTVAQSLAAYKANSQ